MLTKEQIQERAKMIRLEGHPLDAFGQFLYAGGATWANEQNAAEIAELVRLLKLGIGYFVDYDTKIEAEKLVAKYEK